MVICVFTVLYWAIYVTHAINHILIRVLNIQLIACNMMHCMGIDNRTYNIITITDDV